MKNKFHIAVTLLITLCILSVATGTVIYIVLPPKIIRHPKPILTVQYEPFEKLGCKIDFNQANYSCPDTIPWKERLGNRPLKRVSNLVGGLIPSYSIVNCEIGYPNEYQALIRIQAQMKDMCYIIFDGKEYKVIDNEEEFRNIFAPIESEEEALSYAIAVKYLNAQYGIIKNYLLYEYLVDTIEETHVVKGESGYDVYLFYHMRTGCGPFYTYSITINVSEMGEIRASWKPISRDRLLTGLCVD